MSGPVRYRHNPIYVDVMTFDGTNPGEIIKWVKSVSHQATAVYYPPSSGTDSEALPRREARIRIGQSLPGGVRADRIDLLVNDSLVSDGKKFAKLDWTSLARDWQPNESSRGGVRMGHPDELSGVGEESVAEGDDDERSDEPQDTTSDDSVDEVQDSEHEEDDGEDDEEKAHGAPVPTDSLAESMAQIREAERKALTAPPSLIGDRETGVGAVIGGMAGFTLEPLEVEDQ